MIDSRQVEFIDAWNQIWKLAKFRFEQKHPLLCGFYLFAFMSYYQAEEALSSSNYLDHD